MDCRDLAEALPQYGTGSTTTTTDRGGLVEFLSPFFFPHCPQINLRTPDSEKETPTYLYYIRGRTTSLIFYLFKSLRDRQGVVSEGLSACSVPSG